MALEQTATSLAPGFRFHPTDEELVRYYLKRKVMNKPFRFDPISVTDVYKSEPWDLPSKSRLKSRDLEWYFFSMLDKKYGNGSKTNRATEKGYWKTTGKDRAIKWKSRAVAMKKTLVYHQGRAPKGERSNWVMHEYRLVDDELERAGIAQDSFVLCRIFQKSGTGPKNGEQYGAPFLEEEWDDVDDEPIDALCSDALLAFPDDTYVESDVLFRNPEPNSTDNEISPFKGTFPDRICYENAPEDSAEADVKPSMTANEEDKILTDFPFESYFDGETFDSNENNLLSSFSPDTTDFDAVAEYLTFFDADESNPEFGGSENIPTVKEEPEEASCSRKAPPVEYEPDTKPALLKRKSHLLGSGHVSEYPLKETGLLLQPGQPSTSIHVTAGLIRVETVRWVWPGGKNMEVEVIGGKLGFQGWALLILVWVVMLSISYRVVLDVTAKM